MSLGIFVQGRHKPDSDKRNIAFGTYVLVYIFSTKTMKSRNVPNIYFRASNDSFYLPTTEKIHLEVNSNL